MSVKVDFKGLVNAPGLLARDPASCTEIVNFRIPAPGVIRKRTGFQRLASGISGGPIWSVMTSRLLGDLIVAHIGDSATGLSLRVGDGTAAPTAITALDGLPVTRTTNPRLKLAEAGNGYAHYLNSAEGVRRYEVAAPTSLRSAGMPRGMAPDTAQMNAAIYTVITPAAGSWLANGSNVAYRVTWHRYDAFGASDNAGAVYGGPPTGRVVIRNIAGSSGHTGGIANVTLRIPLPFEWGSLSTVLTTSYFWRLWRSQSSATGTAGDEMYLVAEAFVTAGEIAAGYATVVDVTPDSLITGGPKLHTNETDFPELELGKVNGILNADDPPPLAQDLAGFAGCLWMGNVTERASALLTLVALCAPADTITVNGTVLTAVAGAPAANQFTAVVGLATLALNLEAQARNIVEAINATTATTAVRAYHLSQGAQSPGTILVEHYLHGQSLTMASSVAVFRPNVVGSRTFGDVAQTNTVAFSKPGRPDAVPPINRMTFGQNGTRVLRLMPQGDSLLVIADSGVYRITGSSFQDFTVTPLEQTFRCLSHDLIAQTDDAVYAWGIEGIAEITESGLRIISTPIEPYIRSFTDGANQLIRITANGFAVGYRLAHRVLFLFNPSSTNPDALGWIEWDARTQTWAQGQIRDGKSCGCVRSTDDRLVLGNWNAGSTDAYLFLERFPGEASAYSDEWRNGDVTAVESTLTFQLQVPGVSARPHWRQLLLEFERGEQAAYVLPTVMSVTWAVDGATSTYAATGLDALNRFETPDGLRRATRQSIKLTHDTSEHCGIIAVEQDYDAGSRFPGGGNS